MELLLNNYRKQFQSTDYNTITLNVEKYDRSQSKNGGVLKCLTIGVQMSVIFSVAIPSIVE